MKNAPGLGPRQRHHLHAMLGGVLTGTRAMEHWDKDISFTV